MKKKLNLFCVLMLLLMVAQVVTTFVITGENVNLLRLTGIGLLIITVFILCPTLWEGENFAVAFDETIGLMIFSVFNLIVAEAFAIGLKLKEEQKLTI